MKSRKKIFEKRTEIFVSRKKDSIFATLYRKALCPTAKEKLLK
jgi:hypothetical protein